MPNFEKVTLLTTPSTHIRDDLPRTPQPYKRVAGLQVEQHPTVWSFDHKPDDDITTSTYNLNEVPAQRLLEYFALHFSQESTRHEADSSRNCFHFGVWMVRGLLLPSRREASEMVFDNARYTPPVTDNDNRPGSLSVIRSVEDLPEEPVLHGMIKLGSGNDDYIQIMTRGGALGVTTAADSLGYRTTSTYREQVVRQYSVDPIAWKVGHFSVSSALQPDY